MLKKFHSTICLVCKQPTYIADFSQVQSVLILAAGDTRHQVQIRIAGALEPLTITCSSAELSKQLASLIDGYCRLVSGDSDNPVVVWKRTGRNLELTDNDDENSYCYCWLVIENCGWTRGSYTLCYKIPDKLTGVCPSAPMSVVTELAEFGEVCMTTMDFNGAG